MRALLSLILSAILVGCSTGTAPLTSSTGTTTAESTTGGTSASTSTTSAASSTSGSSAAAGSTTSSTSSGGNSTTADSSTGGTTGTGTTSGGATTSGTGAGTTGTTTGASTTGGNADAGPCFAYDAPLAQCANDQFCCGWGDGGFWSSPEFCGTADAGDCFTAPHPPWCTVDCSETIGDSQCTTDNDIAMPGCFYEGFAGGVNYCEPACRTDWPWMCPAGFSCQPYDADFSYVPIPNNPASLCDPVCGSTQLDGGFTPGDANANPPRPDVQSCYCPCVGNDISQCAGLGGDQTFCDSFTPDGGGTCAYGNFCRPGGGATCAGAGAG